MGLKKASKLATLLTAGAMLFSPLKSYAQSLSFHIGDMLNKQDYTEIGSSLEGINITLEDLSAHQIIAQLTTDENGNTRYNFTRVLEPNYNLDRNNISSVRIFDLQGRLEETHYNPYFRESSDKPSGMRFYLFRDIHGNSKAVKSLNIEREVRNGIVVPNKDEVQKYGRKGIARTNDIRNIRLVVSDPDTAYFRFIDTLNVDDAQNLELKLDLFPNVELEWPPIEQWPERWNGVPPYRNFLHFLKRILYSTDEDIAEIGNRLGGWQHVRWPRFPIDIFPNDREAPNDNYRNSIRNFEEDISDIIYGDYSHDFVNLVDAVPDSGSRYDFSREGSAWNVHTVRRIVNGDTLIVVVNGEIYVNNTNTGSAIRRATYHESLNQLVIGRDSNNPVDIQSVGGGYPDYVLSQNDKLLLISVKNIPPYYRKLLNHREIGE